MSVQTEISNATFVVIEDLEKKHKLDLIENETNDEFFTSKKNKNSPEKPEATQNSGHDDHTNEAVEKKESNNNDDENKNLSPENEETKSNPNEFLENVENDKTNIKLLESNFDCRTNDKKIEEFRNYASSQFQDRVSHHYTMMRQNQTVEYVNRMNEKYNFTHPRAYMTIREAFIALENYVDSSDPDLDLPNLLHMLQTAEGIRKAGHPDWFQLTGLIHDMGKIMYLWGDVVDGQHGSADSPQWGLGGDTWVVGCRIPDVVVFPEFNQLNPDMSNELYNTEYGIYTPNCGLENLNFTFGHDEYLYKMLLANKTTIPEKGLWMIRYHSAYCWHTGGAYSHLLLPEDTEIKRWVLEFNKFDLYTKDETNDLKIEDVWPYYQQLIDKYLPGKLMW